MKTIWKYSLDVVDGPQIRSIPSPAQLVHVESQAEEIALWYIIDSEMPRQRRVFEVVGTGHPITPAYSFVGTATIGRFVWHVFEQ